MPCEPGERIVDALAGFLGDSKRLEISGEGILRRGVQVEDLGEPESRSVGDLELTNPPYLPLCLAVELAHLNEFAAYLSLAGASETVQDEHLALAIHRGEVGVHLVQDVLPSGVRMRWRRAGLEHSEARRRRR